MTDGNPDAKPNDANPGDHEGDKGKPRIEFSPEQQAEVDRIVAREKRDAAKRAADAAKAERDAADDAARVQRERKAAEERGEYDKVRADVERERDEAKDAAKRLADENDRLRAAMAAAVETDWKALPAEVKDAYVGADDDVLARYAWLPKGKALAEKLNSKNPAAGNGANPPAATGKAPTQDVTNREMRRRMGLPV